jgi:hypothetical protein
LFRDLHRWEFAMKPLVPLLAGLALLGAAGAASAADSCFRMNQVRGHSIVDPHTLYIGTEDHAVYRVTMSGSCLAAKDSYDPLITREQAGSDLVCKPIDLDLAVGGPGGVSHCIVAGIQKLSPAEVAAIPKKQRP